MRDAPSKPPSKKPGKSGAPVEGPEWSFDVEVAKARYEMWFPDLSPEHLSKIILYQEELIKFNRTINLVSPLSLRTAEATHFADSILASNIIAKSLIDNAPLYDFGSGNGFPGLIYALLYPQAKVILIDRDKRKLEFCKHVVATLGIKNVTVEAVSIEDLKAGSVVNVVARGFASLQKSMLVARKQVGKGGRFFHMKSDGWTNELGQVQSQLFSFWSPSLLGQYRIPETSNDMFVVMTEKISD